MPQKYKKIRYLCPFKMKIVIRTIIIALGLAVLLFSACKEKPRGPLPELNIDSLFVDLGKANVALRTAMAEKTFKEM